MSTTTETTFGNNLEQPCVDCGQHPLRAHHDRNSAAFTHYYVEPAPTPAAASPEGEHSPLPWYMRSDRGEIYAHDHGTVCDFDIDVQSDSERRESLADMQLVVRAVNSHAALVEALRYTHNGHGHYSGCVRELPPNPSRPCRKSCELARAALKEAGVQP